MYIHSYMLGGRCYIITYLLEGIHGQFSKSVHTRGEAIMLVKLSIIFSAILIILPIMLTDFTYSQNYTWFNAHGISDS